MFDIDSIKESQVGTLRLKHPDTGKLIGAEIDFAGPSHPKRKQIEFDRARAVRARVAKRGRIEMSDPEDDAQYEMDRLIGITLGWRGVHKEGREVPCSPDAIRALYGQDWIRQQIEEYLGEVTSFLHCAGSSSSSESVTQ